MLLLATRVPINLQHVVSYQHDVGTFVSTVPSNFLSFFKCKGEWYCWGDVACVPPFHHGTRVWLNLR